MKTLSNGNSPGKTRISIHVKRKGNDGHTFCSSYTFRLADKKNILDDKHQVNLFTYTFKVDSPRRHYIVSVEEYRHHMAQKHLEILVRLCNACINVIPPK
jgi:hypothetical protein